MSTEVKLPPSGAQVEVQAEGFGKLYPSAQPDQEQDESSGGEEDPTSNVISRKELEKGRLSKHGRVKSDWLFIVSTVGDEQPPPPKGFVASFVISRWLFSHRDERHVRL